MTALIGLVTICEAFGSAASVWLEMVTSIELRRIEGIRLLVHVSLGGCSISQLLVRSIIRGHTFLQPCFSGTIRANAVWRLFSWSPRLQTTGAMIPSLRRFMIYEPTLPGTISTVELIDIR